MNRALVLGLVFLCSFFAFSGIASPAHSQTTFFKTCAAVSYDDFWGFQANFTNPTQSNYVVDVFFAWFNSADQIVSIGGQINTTIVAGQTVSFINAYFVPGAYFIQSLVENQYGDAISTSCSGQVTVP